MEERIPAQVIEAANAVFRNMPAHQRWAMATLMTVSRRSGYAAGQDAAAAVLLATPSQETDNGNAS